MNDDDQPMSFLELVGMACGKKTKPPYACKNPKCEKRERDIVFWGVGERLISMGLRSRGPGGVVSIWERSRIHSISSRP